MHTTCDRVKEFYPLIDLSGMRHLAILVRLQEHLRLAKLADRERESRLCNRLGSLRRSVPRLADVPSDVREVMKEAVQFLRSRGRTVNFMDEDPSRWITTRGGKPRW